MNVQARAPHAHAHVRSHATGKGQATTANAANPPAPSKPETPSASSGDTTRISSAALQASDAQREAGSPDHK